MGTRRPGTRRPAGGRHARAGRCWCAGFARRTSRLPASSRAAPVGDSLDETVEHARTRVQFGRAIGTFQAVAHPIVDTGLGLAAAGQAGRGRRAGGRP
ncbi:acyl-CoA dehydrogenase family protein [Yinghuangia aomiensis]